MSEPLRPLTLGEILDRTAQLYRRHFLLFAGVAAVPTAAILVAFAPVGAIFTRLVFQTAKGSATPNESLALLVIAAILLAIPVAAAATVVSHTALTKTAIGANTGESLKIRTVLRSVWPRFWRYLLLFVLQFTLAFLVPAAIASALVIALIQLAKWAGGAAAATSSFLGFVLVCVVAFAYIVWRVLGYSLALPTCIVEEKTAWHSLKRSVTLSRGARGRIFVMFLLIWALSIVVSIVGYIPLVIATVIAAAMGKGAQHAAVVMVCGEILDVIIHFAIQALITPVYTTALVLFYYDQRVRTEGYDIEWMMEQAGLIVPTAIPASSEDATTFSSAPVPDTVKER